MARTLKGKYADALKKGVSIKKAKAKVKKRKVYDRKHYA